MAIWRSLAKFNYTESNDHFKFNDDVMREYDSVDEVLKIAEATSSL